MSARSIATSTITSSTVGSTVGLTNGSGAKVNSYVYDPYGNILHQTKGASNPWKFAGGFLDSSTSLYKFGTRYDEAYSRNRVQLGTY